MIKIPGVDIMLSPYQRLILMALHAILVRVMYKDCKRMDGSHERIGRELQDASLTSWCKGDIHVRIRDGH